MTTTGHCLCRAIQFAFDGAPNATLHCHCESCRRATSSPMTTWISVPRAAFRWTRGAPVIFRSRADVRRGFCGACGSPLFYENDAHPDEIDLYAAALSNGSPVAPTRHVFVQEQLPWFEVDDALPRYATVSRGGAAPVRFGPR